MDIQQQIVLKLEGVITSILSPIVELHDNLKFREPQNRVEVELIEEVQGLVRDWMNRRLHDLACDTILQIIEYTERVQANEIVEKLIGPAVTPSLVADAEAESVVVDEVAPILSSNGEHDSDTGESGSDEILHHGRWGVVSNRALKDFLARHAYSPVKGANGEQVYERCGMKISIPRHSTDMHKGTLCKILKRLGVQLGGRVIVVRGFPVLIVPKVESQCQ